MRWDLELPGRECFAWGFYTKPHMAPAGAPNTPLVLMAAISRKVYYCSFVCIHDSPHSSWSFWRPFGVLQVQVQVQVQVQGWRSGFLSIVSWAALYWAVWYGKLSLRRRQHWDPPESLQKVLTNSTASAKITS
jgi:hypothetical protein